MAEPSLPNTRNMATHEVTAAEPASPSEQIRLQKAWDERMGITHNPVRYDRTAVLLMHWREDEDDLHTADEVKRLRQVFEEDYKYVVHDAVLSTRNNAALEAQKLLIDYAFEYRSDPNTLLLIYYAGHGYSEANNQSGSIRLLGHTKHNEKDSIDWKDVEYCLKNIHADILLIFDCCYAGLLCEPHERSRQEVCFQVLAACDWNATTPSAGPTSFTSALIWALKELKDRRSFSTLELKTMIRKHKEFSEDQVPRLSFRMGNSRPECIYLARMGLEVGHDPDPSEDIRRLEYLDIRLHFNSELTYDKILETCDALRSLKAKDSDFARQIQFIGKNRLAPHVEKAARKLGDVFKRRREAKARLNASSSPIEPRPILKKSSTMPTPTV